jgi:predicted small lipoprotein YifL
MTGRTCRASLFCLALAALAACGLKGDPSPPEPRPVETEG